MNATYKNFILIFAAASVLAACIAPPPRQSPAAAPAGNSSRPTQTLTVMTHDSFAVSENVLAAFEAANNVKVTVLKSGDAGSVLNKAILSKGKPLADVLYGVDNTFLSRALNADLFETYAAPALANIPERLKLDVSNRLLPIDFGHVVVNYDKAIGAAPESLKALTEPKWKGKLVVQNAATSSPGLAFLLATVAAFPEGSAYDWKQFWRDLRANDVFVSNDWSDAYYTQFSGSSGKGPRPLVVSYQTSPAAEVFFSEGKLKQPPTGNVAGTAFEQIEFVGILRGTSQRALAEKFVDFMLSSEFQNDIPLQMFVYPSTKTATLPDVFVQFAPVPTQVFALGADQIEKNREAWLAEWTQIVLR